MTTTCARHRGSETPPPLRRRLRAGVLAALFAALSFLPWAHMLAPGAHEGSGGCCAAAGHGPGLTDAEASHACWICDSLPSLLLPDVLTAAPGEDLPPPVSVYAVRAPRAPAHCCIDPANRSQAPPAAA